MHPVHHRARPVLHHTPRRYRDRPLRQHLVHAGIFVGICTAAALDRYGVKDVALYVSLFVNGLWVFHG